MGGLASRNRPRQVHPKKRTRWPSPVASPMLIDSPEPARGSRMRAGNDSAERPTLQAGGTSPYWLCLRLVPLCLLVFAMKPLLAQPAPTQSTAPAGAAHSVESGGFQDRIDAAVLALRGSDPKLKDLPKQYVQGLAEFVSGNMLFVLLHELGHASITQMGLPVLGRMEDAVDSFAALTLIRVGSDFSNGVLTAAAKGWFL